MRDEQQQFGSAESNRTAEFLRLLGQHERDLMAFILAVVPSWPDADDIMQEVRTRLWQQFDDYDPTREFVAWARAIAFWQVQTWRITSRRRAARFNDVILNEIVQHVEATSGEVAERAEALQSCLEQLEPNKRRIVDLYYSGKKSARELADELGRSFHAVRHTLQRTRLALADCIEGSLKSKGRS